MSKHFENLWQEAEEINKKSAPESGTDEILDELILKINLYKAIDKNKDLPNKEEAKSYMMGEILYSLSAISLKDNLNTFKALQDSIILRM